MGTAYQPVAKYLTNLLNLTTTNEFTIQDSFDAVSQINNIPPELLMKDTDLYHLTSNHSLLISLSRKLLT